MPQDIIGVRQRNKTKGSKIKLKQENNVKTKKQKKNPKAIAPSKIKQHNS